MDRELVMYTRKSFCPFVSIAKRVLAKYEIAYREIIIDGDSEAEQRVRGWTGYRSVPTIVIARPGEDLPYEPPAELPGGKSPRGIDRGTMITEPSATQLEAWLRAKGFINEA
ncbi:MAG: hypothetical protein Kow00120_12420 [Anaerolineae bacterium]